MIEYKLFKFIINRQRDFCVVLKIISGHCNCQVTFLEKCYATNSDSSSGQPQERLATESCQMFAT